MMRYSACASEYRCASYHYYHLKLLCDTHMVFGSIRRPGSPTLLPHRVRKIDSRTFLGR